WVAAWEGLAKKLDGEAAAALTDETRRAKYLRASEYYRAAFFYNRSDLDDPVLQENYASHVRCHREAMKVATFVVEPIEIPFENTTLTGYFYSPDDSGKARPTVIVPGGYDGTAEESHPVAINAVARGMNALIFDGPGQGGTLYLRRIPMRPDYENVSPIVNDFALGLRGVDPKALAWVGRSFGGLITPRAVAGDPRIAAMVVDPGQINLLLAVSAKFGPDDLALLDVDTDEARAHFQALLGIPGLAHLFKPRMTTHGVDSVWEYLRSLRDYRADEFAPKIACASLVCDNEFDPVSTGQGQMLFDALTCDKQFHRFTGAEGAAGHCEGAGQSLFFEMAFDWLHSKLTPA
ncbi:MAG: alpha/beta hydrolase, partial [Candidatus Nanopelagicales bacterium]